MSISDRQQSASSKQSYLFGFALLLILSISSCCPDDPYANYLNLIITTEPKSLDPALSTDITTAVLTSLMYNNLVQFGVGTEIEPGLAESWTISDDGLVYTFKLKDSVLFWNGETLTTTDVKHSFERVLDPDTRSPQTWLLTPIEGATAFMRGQADTIQGISRISPDTVQLTLESPFAPFLGFLGAPATALVSSSWGEDLKEQPMGTGPWVFSEWKADQNIRLKRNENYYDGKAKLEGLLLNNVGEILTAALEFEAGNLDVMAIPNSEFKYWTRSSIWKPYIHKLEELGLYYLAMNVDRPPFNDIRVRQAATLAIDRETIIKRVLHNSATLALGAIPPRLSAYDSSRQTLPYDPDRARQLLREAGYNDDCEFDLWVDPGAAVSQTIEAIHYYLSEAGFKVHLVRNDWNMMRDAMRKGETDAYWGNWWADYADAENFLAPLFHTETAATRNRYSNTSVDALIQKLQRSASPEERTSLAQQIDSILVNEAPYVFMWYPIAYTVVQPNLKGYVPHLMPNANRYTEVYFENQETKHD